MKKILLSVITFMSIAVTGISQVMPLYGNEQSIPDFLKCPDKESYKPASKTSAIGIVSNISRPTLEVFLPAKPNEARSAVVICPGGGYSIVAIDHEGKDVAKALNAMGIAAFVLKYRIPDSACMTNKQDAPLTDAQQAIRLVRENAAKYNIDVTKVGILGFSAGGHLASTAGTHFNETHVSNPKKVSLRPDFMVLLYPVISFKEGITHKGSKTNLIGKNAAEELVKHFSNEEQVTANTPPSFLVHALDDNVVPAANSIRFVEALQKNKIPAELHLYATGGHGYGITNKTTKDQWMDRLSNWLLTNNFLK